MVQTKIVAEKLDNEPMQDFIKFLVFLEMGSTRTLSLAYKKYYEYDMAHEVSAPWLALAEKNRWVARVTEYEAQQAASKPDSAPAKPKQERSGSS